MPATLCSTGGAAEPPSGSLCTTDGEGRLWSRSHRWRAVDRVRAAAERIRPQGQAEAAFDVLDPPDDEPEEPVEPEELDDPDEDDDDPELSEDEELDEPEEDSDLPGFTVLVVDVLRESVR